MSHLRAPWLSVGQGNSDGQQAMVNRLPQDQMTTTIELFRAFGELVRSVGNY
jgi:hypothetical protein